MTESNFRKNEGFFAYCLDIKADKSFFKTGENKRIFRKYAKHRMRIKNFHLCTKALHSKSKILRKEFENFVYCLAASALPTKEPCYSVFMYCKILLL